MLEKSVFKINQKDTGLNYNGKISVKKSIHELNYAGTTRKLAWRAIGLSL